VSISIVKGEYEKSEGSDILNLWMKATNSPDKQHPKCIGKTCGTWGMCNANETGILNFGCIYYDDDTENQMIDDEIEAGV